MFSNLLFFWRQIFSQINNFDDFKSTTSKARSGIALSKMIHISELKSRTSSVQKHVSKPQEVVEYPACQEISAFALERWVSKRKRDQSPIYVNLQQSY